MAWLKVSYAVKYVGSFIREGRAEELSVKYSILLDRSDGVANSI